MKETRETGKVWGNSLRVERESCKIKKPAALQAVPLDSSSFSKNGRERNKRLFVCVCVCVKKEKKKSGERDDDNKKK